MLHRDTGLRPVLATFSLGSSAIFEIGRFAHGPERLGKNATEDQNSLLAGGGSPGRSAAFFFARKPGLPPPAIKEFDAGCIFSQSRRPVSRWRVVKVSIIHAIRVIRGSNSFLRMGGTPMLLLFGLHPRPNRPVQFLGIASPEPGFGVFDQQHIVGTALDQNAIAQIQFRTGLTIAE